MSENNPSQNNILTDVVIIRPILVVLLVFYHAFAIYSGGWTPLTGFPEIKLYWWLDKLSYAFMLEMFVLISGYVFGYQVRVKGEEKLQAKNLFIGKFKRLMLPSLVFSTLYFLCFRDFAEQSLWAIFYEIVIGVGHMWFLPMLFSCFVCLWIIEKLHIKFKIVFPLLFLLSISPLPPLPLNLRLTSYYILFFYLGYYIQRHNIGLNRYYNKKNAFILSVVFIFLFISLTWLNNSFTAMIEDNNSMFAKIAAISFNKLSKILYSITGIAAVFSIIGTKKINVTNNKWLFEIGALCMGVYLSQQFILVTLYHYTNLPSLLGPYILPWVGFIIALSGSLLISWLLRQSKIGRILIG